jgi:hypothetical protein
VSRALRRGPAARDSVKYITGLPISRLHCRRRQAWGGISLSKAFGLIERFSEDIDLILDWNEVVDVEYTATVRGAER